MTKKNICSFVLSFLGLTAFLYWQDNDIVVSKITVKNPKIPESFHGFKIAQISDLQNKLFGKNQKRLLKKLKSLNADIIVVTGDLIDCNRTNLKAAMDFIQGAVCLAPVYYVSGNHEWKSGLYKDILLCLKQKGAIPLENSKLFLKRNHEKIVCIGISDKRISPNYKSNIQKLYSGCENYFLILLSHRPENFDSYIDAKIDLSFTGHAHGGQIRIPFIGGIFSPNQGFFPRYTSGIYNKKNCSMIVSRGLGNSKFPFRIFNRPEIVLAKLSKIV